MQNSKPIRPRLLNPLIYEKTANGEEMYDVFSRLMKERILFIGEGIDSFVANSLVSQLLWLDSQNQDKEISLYINSPGGEISAMFAIYDIMQYIKAPVYTYVIGLAASAAAVLLSAGAKGGRYALPNSEIMIHQPWIDMLGGSITDINIQTKQLIRDKRKLISILARHTGKPFEHVERDCERDFFMTPREAIKYGLIDHYTEINKPIPELIHDNKFNRRKR